MPEPEIALDDPLDLSALAGEFLLRRDMVLLNHGSFGACPRPVFEAYQRWQREFEHHPGGFVARWPEMMDQARAALAGYLGTAPDQIGFVTNATMGVNVVAHSLRGWLREGDQILTTDHEYAACDNAWAYVCSKTGARYIRRTIALPVTTPDAWLEAFWAGVTPRTRVVYLSHITSPTALTFPVELVCRRARGRHPLNCGWRTRPRPARSGFGGDRGRLLHRQLPQVAMRAEG